MSNILPLRWKGSSPGSERPLHRRFLEGGRAAAGLLLAAALLLAGTARDAGAQAPVERVPSMRPMNPVPSRTTANNPSPKPHIDLFNRGRAGFDLFWGVTDGNRDFNDPVVSRSNNLTPARRTPSGSRAIEAMGLDGWEFPRAVEANSPFGYRSLINLHDGVGVPPGNANVPGPQGNINHTNGGAGETLAGGLWASITTPPFSSNFLGNGYHRTPAVARTDRAALDEAKFIWRPFVPGPPNTQKRYRIVVHIPRPQDPPTDPNTPPDQVESRISDARYTIRYTVRVSDTEFLRKESVVRISQEAEADWVVVADDGETPLYFPFYSRATFSAANRPTARNGGGLLREEWNQVELENTTEDVPETPDNQAVPENLFVIADSVRFEQQNDMVLTTPTTTPRHGGRKVAVAPPPTPGQEYPQNFQPAGDNFTRTPANPLDPVLPPNDPAYGPGYDRNNGTPLPDGTFGPGSPFINDPSDPVRDPSSPAYDVNSPHFELETDNISVFFEGPESLINPLGPDVRRWFVDTNGNPLFPPIPGEPVNNLPPQADDDLVIVPRDGILRPRQPTEPVDPNVDPTGQMVREYPTNNQLYRNRTTTGTAPFFSHIQVLMPRTEFVQDPELGVSDQNKTGTRWLEVGAVYSVDWLTGTPIWRFPDRTYLPPDAVEPGTGAPIPGRGLRNRIIGQEQFLDRNGQVQTRPVYAVPGIAAFDKNLDGIIQDDEVFISRNGGNPSGKVTAGITILPRVRTRGIVNVPVIDPNDPFDRNATGSTNAAFISVRTAQPGRYMTPGPEFAPVPVSVAVVAAENGVVYAIDMNGNNDNRYFEGPLLRDAIPDVNRNTSERLFGRYRHGTTNVLWTFTASVLGRGQTVLGGLNETQAAFNRRLKRSVPPTRAFTSAPAAAFQEEDRDPATGLPINGFDNPNTVLNKELRLFLPNDNGTLYALDAHAEGVLNIDPNDPNNRIPEELPFRKGAQPSQTLDINGHREHRAELRWWFETNGSLRTTPAVSEVRHTNTGSATLNEKGVYITSMEGRVYSLDWTGPVTTAGNHDTPLNYIGAAQAALEASAEALNDNERFHNANSPDVQGRPDGTEGSVRPRWAFPNRYRDLDNTQQTSNSILAPKKPTDFSRVHPDTRLAEPTTLGPIGGAPVLMDFPWIAPGGTTPQMMRYVLISANNQSTGEGQLLILDQAGNRLDFLTNPQRSPAAGPNRTVVSHPLDRFLPREPLSLSTPVWTYRFQYDRHRPEATATSTPDIQFRNSPFARDSRDAIPSRRDVPTVFQGGLARVYAVDIDPATALFMRWRATTAEQAALMPLPTRPEDHPDGPFEVGEDVPDEATRDILDPVDPRLTAANLANRPVLGRLYPIDAYSDSDVTHLVVSGGPLQNRNATAPVPPADPATATPPGTPDVPNDPTNDPTGRQVNQDINDPISTTRGSRAQPNPTVPVPPGVVLPNEPLTEPGTDPTNYNSRSFQYPMLFVTTRGDAAQPGVVLALSTNIEGEQRPQDPNNRDPLDRSPVNPVIPDALITALNGESANVGWAFMIEETRFNPTQIPQFGFTSGPGGPGGVAVLTNAYYPALDPNYRNQYFNTTAPNELNDYPEGEPNGQNPTQASESYVNDGGVFFPRPLYPGNVARPQDTPPGFPALPERTPDRHTGMTGFPLDVSGLFYNKSFAVDPNPALPVTNNTNDDGRVRLPAYSGIGRDGDITLPDGTTVTLTEFTNELPDGKRPVPVQGQPGRVRIDDINPAGTDVAWVFAPGQNGTLYAYTPFTDQGNTGRVGDDGGSTSAVIDEATGRLFSPGGFSGFPTGGLQTGVGLTTPNVALTGAPKAILVDQATYNNLLSGARGSTPGNAIRPGFAASLAAQGRRQFFEWGETVYIVIFDVLAQSQADVTPGSDSPFYIADVNAALTVTLRKRDRQPGTGAPLITRTVGLERVSAAPNPIAWYPYDPAYSDDFSPATDPPTRLGMAFLAIELDPRRLNREQPLTPGAVIDVDISTPRIFERRPDGTNVPATIAGQIRGGATTRAMANNVQASFAIANPIAIQSFLADTRTGNPANINADQNQDAKNSIGPFASGERHPVKDQYSDAPTPADDPDKVVARYSQALTNGNLILRRDLDVYLNGDVRFPNPQFGTRARSSGGGVDPAFYIPVAASAGYGNHGDIGSTNFGSRIAQGIQQNLRILNRSLIPNLDRIRVEVMDDMVWRTWPGNIPNAPADPDGLVAGNPRKTPQGMDPGGRVNPLPWEAGIPGDVLPWSRDISSKNNSADYSDIPTTAVNRGNAVRVMRQNTDLTNGPGTLPMSRGNQNGLINQTIENPALTAPVLPPFINAPGQVSTTQFTASANITVPKYQPANLVAMHSLTSTYVAPSPDDGVASSNVENGPIQLPRGLDNRQIRLVNLDGTVGNATITPFGYTMRLRVYYDHNGNGRYDGPSTVAQDSFTQGINASGAAAALTTRNEEAYRIVEVWMGVPVDQKITIKEQVIDWSGPAGALPHGFGMLNGLLGYGQGAEPFNVGFVPAPLNIGYNPAQTFYEPFFRKFTVQNEGNVNLWNLRASQKVENVQSDIDNNTTFGDGQPFNYIGMQSQSVDPRHGILAVSPEPSGMNAGNTTRLAPQIVTSLDPVFDLIWYGKTQGDPAYNQNIDPNDVSKGTPWSAYYSRLGGRHTLHKPRPGEPTPTVLGIPDQPGPLLADPTLPQPQTFNPLMGLAVPLGTPSGMYSNLFSNVPLGIFEDHDTIHPNIPGQGYVGVPVAAATGGTLNGIYPAGPLYGGRNDVHLAFDPNAIRPILPNGSEGIFRPRGILRDNNGVLRGLEFLPSTASYDTANNRFTSSVKIQAEVQESPLTGQVPDQALAANNFPANIVTGLLTSVDLFPVIDTSNASALRPVASLAPAAYRSPVDGKLHVYFSSNSIEAGNGANRVPRAQPGATFQLFHTHLNWDTALGTWVPFNPGQMLNAGLAGVTANTGRWFTPPLQVPLPSAAPVQTNTSPFVLVNDAFVNGATGGATLFFLNQVPVAGGTPFTSIYFSPLNADGTPGNLLPLVAAGTGNGALDPSVRRYGPKAAILRAGGNATTFVFYAGGVTGRLGLFYVADAAGDNGQPASNADQRREIPLPLPAAIAQASDPAPVARSIYGLTNTGQLSGLIPVIDVYFTGISRGNRNPDLYMARYAMGGNGGLNTRLVAQRLQRVTRERLEQPGREPLWAAQHIAWVQNLQARAVLPVIYIQTGGNGPIEPLQGSIGNTQNAWRYDTASGLLYQAFRRNNQNGIAYIDASAGTVRFRGAGAPTSRDIVFADYEPQVYRITTGTDATSDTNAVTFMDEHLLVQTTDQNRRSSVLTRPGANPLPVGRQWIMWQKGARSGQPAAPFYTTRRVGIDLRSIPPPTSGNIGGLKTANDTTNETLLLTPQDPATRNQRVNVTVNVAGTNITDYEVDPAKGRIYVPSSYEGLPVVVTYQAATANPNTPANPVDRQTPVGLRLQFIDEIGTTSSGNVQTDNAGNVIGQSVPTITGQLVPMKTVVNEGQPYAFLDRFDPVVDATALRGDPLSIKVNRPTGGVVYPAPAGDPMLQPWRVWMFWTSPRGRVGIVPEGILNDLFPTGYDIYYQTLAPTFETESRPGLTLP